MLCVEVPGCAFPEVIDVGAFATHVESGGAAEHTAFEEMGSVPEFGDAGGSVKVTVRSVDLLESV